MLLSMRDFENYAVQALDGPIGIVRDLYFDDEAWVVRYLVIETGPWLLSRKVLISPIAIGSPGRIGQVLPLSITKEQVKNSPDIDTEKPVSRQHESSYLRYYNYPAYWGGAGLWGGGAYPGGMLTGVGYGGLDAEYRQMEASNARELDEPGRDQVDDQHLRSCKATMGYHIHATDGDIGHVRGVLVDEETWAVRYMIVDTSNWWLGHHVLIAPQWIQAVSWSEEAVSVLLTRQAIKEAPPYDPSRRLDRSDEHEIYKHYQRAGYWIEGVTKQEVCP